MCASQRGTGGQYALGGSNPATVEAIPDPPACCHRFPFLRRARIKLRHYQPRVRLFPRSGSGSRRVDARFLMMRTRFARSFGAVVMLALVPVPALAAGAPVSGSRGQGDRDRCVCLCVPARADGAFAAGHDQCGDRWARQSGGAPMNQFAHLRAFPDATFTDVAKPNAARSTLRSGSMSRASGP